VAIKGSMQTIDFGTKWRVGLFDLKKRFLFSAFTFNCKIVPCLLFDLKGGLVYNAPTRWSQGMVDLRNLTSPSKLSRTKSKFVVKSKNRK
jgi:hypothetical protein